MEGGLLAGEELVGVGAQSSQIPAMVFDLGSDRADEVHEVLLDYPNDVEAIGDDLGIREVLADQRTVGGTQIHADDADVFFAFESGEVGVKVLRITTFDDIEDPVSSQVAEGGGEPGSAPVAGSLSLDGVLVDAEDRRADAVGTFSGDSFGVLVIEAFDRSGADAFAMGKDAARDAVAMLFVDEATEGFGGVPVGLDAGERREEGLAAPSALIPVGVDLQINAPTEGVEVADGPEIGPLAVGLQSPGLAPLVWGSFRPTARAVRTSRLVSLQVHDRVKAMLLDALDLIPCNSDFLDLQ